VPIRIEPYVGHWLPLRAEDRSRLGRPGARRSAPLGVSAVAGAKVWDRQYKIRLHIGPLTLAQYQQFLPGQPSQLELRDWMRQLIGFDMLWDIQLVLKGQEIPALGLRHKTTQLGRTTWLGRKTPHPDRGELRLNPASSTKGKHHG
jgi:type VI secretion system protein ImpH